MTIYLRFVDTKQKVYDWDLIKLKKFNPFPYIEKSQFLGQNGTVFILEEDNITVINAFLEKSNGISDLKNILEAIGDYYEGTQLATENDRLSIKVCPYNLKNLIKLETNIEEITGMFYTCEKIYREIRFDFCLEKC